jgi:hypothetical protein
MIADNHGRTDFTNLFLNLPREAGRDDPQQQKKAPVEEVIEPLKGELPVRGKKIGQKVKRGTQQQPSRNVV